MLYYSSTSESADCLSQQYQDTGLFYIVRRNETDIHSVMLSALVMFYLLI